MSVRFSNGRQESRGNVESLLRNAGTSLDESYVAFVCTNDGAVPEPNRFVLSPSVSLRITRFIPVSEILKEQAKVQPSPKGAIPIAWAEGGNYVLLGGDTSPGIYFWDHEVEVSPLELTKSFGDLLNRLQPFDPSAVPLDPKQVKSAWIDPAFLDRIKENLP